MFGAGASGSFSKSSSRSKTQNLTQNQKEGMRALYQYYFNPYFARGKNIKPGDTPGAGLPGYEGKLAGTETGKTLSNLFAQSDVASGGGQSELFSHYDYFQDPEARVQAAVANRDALLAADYDKEDALLREKMRNMGLQHSTDALEQQSQINRRRQAEKAVYADSIRQRYEELGFEAGEAELASIQNIGDMQHQIVNMGLEAEYNEWLRTRPENNPMIQTMMQYLGLATKSDTTVHGQGWTASGSASYGTG